MESLGPPRRLLMAPPLRFGQTSTTPRAWSPSRQVQSGYLPAHPINSSQLSCLDMLVARSVLLWSRPETQTHLQAEVENSHRLHFPDLHPGGLSESDITLVRIPDWFQSSWAHRVLAIFCVY